MRGRPPVPKAINELRGDPGRRRRYEKEPEAPSGIPDCPEHLDNIAKAEWFATASILKDMGLLSRADRAALEMYCSAYSRYRKAAEHVAKYGEVILTKFGLTGFVVDGLVQANVEIKVTGAVTIT